MYDIYRTTSKEWHILHTYVRTGSFYSRNMSLWLQKTKLKNRYIKNLQQRIKMRT